ncbi:NADH dehydrogenase [ubiquinone] flavoprotein 3, mitochondrial [Anopheles stephensi]|uniref:NADH dehydrogenase [ubiquinone] flavoprotein 3, mitochondrial n=1 Tax=Anopheles stephensi TaxID=30069 RepID=UPI001658B5F9|nr:NADH dehydrogenase [ubiquinone] flavoprotein 3, mitochondrial [Anopheles stephensi]
MIRQILLKNDILVKLVAARAYSQPAPPSAPKGPSAPAAPADVPGLSSRCVAKKDGPVGPGAERNGTYKVPEYFSYNTTSYFEAEIEMSKFRIPQPSAKN